MLTLARGNEAFEKLFAKDQYIDLYYITIAFAAFRAGQRSGPMLPEQFDKRLGELTFTSGADKEKVRPKYHDSFRILVSRAQEVSFRRYNLNTEAAEEALHVVLTHCHQMTKFDLACNREWKGQVERLGQAVAASQCCSKLTVLDMEDCEEVSGDIGRLAPLVHLITLNLACTKVSGDVQGLAKLVDLETLNLGLTQVSGNVRGLAKLVDLEELNLTKTQVSGDVAGLAPLTKLAKLYLIDTKVQGDFQALKEQHLLRIQRFLPPYGRDIAHDLPRIAYF